MAFREPCYSFVMVLRRSIYKKYFAAVLFFFFFLDMPSYLRGQLFSFSYLFIFCVYAIFTISQTYKKKKS